ncbi:MAG: ribosome assembly cofactor RimP [Oscillospiraceae bacterium]|jgi:ribosome maturation factor RimP|nr:ribosome assembly cofactor RimP [Oscillospiraceae bacterium]
MSVKIEERARGVAEPFLKENGCRLWDVIFEKEGAMRYLRILFDDGGGPLDMEKCERMTPPLNRLMDAEDFIKYVDILEIGSPGTSRRLRRPEHFEACAGKTVKVTERAPSGKTETVTGVLRGFDAGNRAIVVNSRTISLKNCIRINLEEQQQ